MVLNSLSFCLSVKLLISPSYLNEILAGYSNLGGRLFSPITSWEIDGEIVETMKDFIFGAPKSLQMVTAAIKLKDAYSLEGKL